MFDDLVWEVDAEGIPGKTKAEADGTVLATESDVGVEVEHGAVLAQVRLVRDGLDVVLAVPDESAVGKRAAVLQQALRESNRR